ncbi:MAG: ABC transporter ATP-binding protein [Acidobacteriota bacterium]
MHVRQLLIKITGLRKVYTEDDGVPVEALRGIDLEIREGEFTAVVGPSGSGKTTLLNLISGLDIPTDGSIELAGRRVESMSDRELADFRRDHIGFIFQAHNLIPVLTVRENVEYVMLLQGVEPAERSRRIRRVLEELGLAEMEDRFPTQLSGGQQQRVAVARAVVTQPQLVLADEPTANLDSVNGRALIAMMRKLNEEHGTTFIFSTHDPMIMEQARRLIVLQDGRIAQDEWRDRRE